MNNETEYDDLDGFDMGFDSGQYGGPGWTIDCPHCKTRSVERLWDLPEDYPDPGTYCYKCEDLVRIRTSSCG